VRHRSDGERPEAGVIYAAPPDVHLLLKREHDPLFRRAAASYGARCIGVLLSGVLDDGASGLLAISQAGGIVTEVQPEED
jgi:two-component system chemotaxis response regulator CheB